MGTEICQNCNNNKNIYIEKNLSNKNYLENQKAIDQLNHLIKNQNKSDKIESDISTKINNNEIDNNITNYENPLYNTSLDESMNLGNCYIGTNKNNTKIKPYDPENSLQNIMNKKRLSIDKKSVGNEFNFNKRMNKTSKNFNRRKIKYNLFFNNDKINDIDENAENIFENGVYYNNSNKKNNKTMHKIINQM